MTPDHFDAVVIGGGPAGLMAADVLSNDGANVMVCEAKPSLGRKFLMAGKSGLNLTKVGDTDFLAAYAEAAPYLAPMISAFDPNDVMSWAEGLGQSLFTGTTGRVFPEVMKASPLLRAWLERLGRQGVEIRTRHSWEGWDRDKLRFAIPEGSRDIRADVTVLAMGGASWPRLGSDAAWTKYLRARGVGLSPFAPANAALRVAWSDHMRPVFGLPLKAVALSAGPFFSRGEAILSAQGLEGGGVYAISRGVREGHILKMDLVPDLDAEAVAEKLARVRGKPSLSARLRKALSFGPLKLALVNECLRPAPASFQALAHALKALQPKVTGLADIESAISVSGGVSWTELDSGLMLKKIPGTYCAGEMVDWEAPTGGYLLTACLAMGKWAGHAALDRLRS